MLLHRHHLTAAAAALLLALTASGCGLNDDHDSTTTTQATTTQASPANATDNPAPQTQPQPGPGAVKITAANTKDPRVETAARYAANAVSFTPENWIDQQTRLKQLATGDELVQLEKNSSVVQRQQQVLQQSRQTSAGRVLAADISTSTADSATVVVVVKVTGTGTNRNINPGAADYDVAEVGLTHTTAGWRVNAYTIQP